MNLPTSQVTHSPLDKALKDGPNPPNGPPPPYSDQASPVSARRIPLNTQGPFAAKEDVGEVLLYDMDQQSPVYFGSAMMGQGVHPCKIVPHLTPLCRIPYGGSEIEHHGRYDLLPFNSEKMQLVPASGGRVPPGKRPVIGGYEEDGKELYHAVANVNGVEVPGKTGEHLPGCNVAFGGLEHVVEEYKILCWRL